MGTVVDFSCELPADDGFDDAIRLMDKDLHGMAEDTGGEKQYVDEVGFSNVMASAHTDFVNQGQVWTIQYYSKGWARIGRKVVAPGTVTPNDSNTGIAPVNTMLHQKRLDDLRQILEETLAVMENPLEKQASSINKVIANTTERGYRCRFHAACMIKDNGAASDVNTEGKPYLSEECTNGTCFVLTIEKAPYLDKKRDVAFDGKCVESAYNMKVRTALHFHCPADISAFVSALYSKLSYLYDVPKELKDPFLRCIGLLARTARAWEVELKTKGNPNQIKPWTQLLNLVSTFRTDVTNTTLWSNVCAAAAPFFDDEDTLKKMKVELRRHMVRLSPLTVTRAITLRRLWHQSHPDGELDQMEMDLPEVKLKSKTVEENDDEDDDENLDPNVAAAAAAGRGGRRSDGQSSRSFPLLPQHPLPPQMPATPVATGKRRKPNILLPSSDDDEEEDEPKKSTATKTSTRKQR